MRAFVRPPQPDFWHLKESSGGRETVLHERQHHKRTLAEWYWCTIALARAPVTHDDWLSFEAAEHSLRCAYCDGLLDPPAKATIDHFAPITSYPWFAVSWWNLYPACSRCNTEKGDRFSRLLLRPDCDPVHEWLDYEPQTGILRVAPEYSEDRLVCARVKKTVRYLGLNEPDIRRARKRTVDTFHAKKTSLSAEEQQQWASILNYSFLLERLSHRRARA